MLFSDFTMDARDKAWLRFNTINKLPTILPPIIEERQGSSEQSESDDYDSPHIYNIDASEINDKSIDPSLHLRNFSTTSSRASFSKRIKSYSSNLSSLISSE
mmetsp:Transcript_45295/g.53037  ORF Transcript_45295/g.53037 Transcript_45295/m.53037 type:complete len:102 (-) Transcript_45295:205-510(-)